jgi:hypothetical protein
LSTLGITEEPFAAMSGNTIGYAKPDQKIIAVSPLAYNPMRTKFHECAHVLLHPGMTSQHAENSLPRDVKEAEAELTAYIGISELGLTDGLEYSRGYLRNWIDDKTAEKIRFGKVFSAVDQILRAGREPEPERPGIRRRNAETLDAA